MKTCDYNERIEISGVSFDGIADVIHHAHQQEPKNGIYVGEDAESYPCFDSYDSSDHRSYHNFVFAGSPQELEEKMAKLKAMRPLQSNYNKLTPALHPMAYWAGDPYYKVYLTDEAQ